MGWVTVLGCWEELKKAKLGVFCIFCCIIEFFSSVIYIVVWVIVTSSKIIKKGIYMRHIRRNLKAISPVLAVLMMIAVAIAGSLVVYAWVMGYIDLSTGKSGQAIMIQSVANDPTNTDLKVYVQNVGEGLVQLDETGCLYVNGELTVCDITGVAVSDHVATLNQGDTATLTVGEGAALPGVKYDVKVTTKLGTSAAKSSYPAGKARAAPVLDHFEFDTIDSPQISGFDFIITIFAIDQYDGKYTEYTSTNTLDYSGGDITPIVTGGFVAGEWTGNVTVLGTADDAVISTAAAFDETIVGVSNTFDVDAAVTFISAGVGGKDGTAVTTTSSPRYPTGMQAGDLILLQIGIRDATNTPDEAALNAAGFELLFEAQDATAAVGQWIYYKWSTGTETGTVTISTSGTPTNVISQMTAYRYVKTLSFTEDDSETATENDVISAPTVTSVGPRRLDVAFLYMNGYQATVDEFDGETGGDWILQSEFQNSITMSTEDSAIQLQTALMLEAGTISGGTTRVGDDMPDTQDSWIIIAFALIPID